MTYPRSPVFGDDGTDWDHPCAMSGSMESFGLPPDPLALLDADGARIEPAPAPPKRIGFCLPPAATPGDDTE